MGEEDDERSRTIFCGNLHDDVTEDLLYELFLQVRKETHCFHL